MKIKNEIRVFLSHATQKHIPSWTGDFRMTDAQRELKEHRRISFASITLLLSIITIHNIAIIYDGNVDEFQFNLPLLYVFLVPVFVIMVLIFISMYFFFTGIRRRVYIYFLYISSATAWLYSNFVVLDAGFLDGTGLDFTKINAYVPYEAILYPIYIFAIVVILIKKPVLARNFIIVLNIILLVPTLYTLLNDSKEATLAQRPNVQEVYKLSREQNVIIILMDAFQSDIFADLLKAEPDLEDELTGFEFYPDTLGVATTTYLTLPSIHSGEIYRAGYVLRDFYREQTQERSFLTALANGGHEVTLVNPLQQSCPDGVVLCITLSEVIHGKWHSLFSEVVHLLDLSIFRATPLVLKNVAYNRGYWLVSSALLNLSFVPGTAVSRIVENNRFLEKLAERSAATTDRPVTKFLHLFNTHPPFVLNKECRISNNVFTEKRVAATTQARCAVREFVGFLESLKAKGLYDGALIALIADTGVGIPSRYITSNTAQSESWARRVGAANPIFLIKPPQARLPFRTVSRGVQISDLAATICSLTIDCPDISGTSVFEIPPAAQRKRIYNDYRWRHEYWGKDTIPDITAYEVQGPLWEPESWGLNEPSGGEVESEGLAQRSSND